MQEQTSHWLLSPESFRWPLQQQQLRRRSVPLAGAQPCGGGQLHLSHPQSLCARAVSASWHLQRSGGNPVRGQPQGPRDAHGGRAEVVESRQQAAISRQPSSGPERVDLTAGQLTAKGRQPASCPGRVNPTTGQPAAVGRQPTFH